MDGARATKEYERISSELIELPKQIYEIDLSLIELERHMKEEKGRLQETKDSLSGLEAGLLLKVNAEPGKSNKEEREAKVQMLMAKDESAIGLKAKIRRHEDAISSYEYEIAKLNAEKSLLVTREGGARYQARLFLGLMNKLASDADMKVFVNGKHEEIPM